MLRDDALRGLRAGEDGHHQIHDDDVGMCFRDESYGGFAVFSLPHDCHSRVASDERGEPHAHYRVVVG